LDSGAADPEGLRQLQRGVCDFALDRFDGDAEQSCELGDTAGDAIGRGCLGASDRFMARRRFQSSPSAPLGTIGGSSRCSADIGRERNRSNPGRNGSGARGRRTIDAEV
jgi:hypothetical protein